MNIKKIVLALTISVLISAGLYYGIPAVSPTTEITAVLTSKINLTMCIMIGAGVGIIYLMTSYRPKATAETDIPMKKFQYLYNLCDDELKNEIESVCQGEMDKLRYVECTEPLLTQEQKTALNNYVFNLRTPQQKTGMKIFSKLAIVAFLGFVGYTGYETYQDAKPAVDNYVAMLNATYDDQVLYIDGLPPIQLISNGTFKQIDVNTYIEKNIKTQPQFLLENCHVIKLYSGAIFTELTGYDRAHALSYDMSINIPLSDTSKRTATHELGHVYDFKYGLFWVSSSAEFQNLWQTYRGTFEFPKVDNDYCNNAAEEFFAETTALFVNQPEYLKNNCEPLYNYFEALYQ